MYPHTYTDSSARNMIETLAYNKYTYHFTRAVDGNSVCGLIVCMISWSHLLCFDSRGVWTRRKRWLIYLFTLTLTVSLTLILFALSLSWPLTTPESTVNPGTVQLFSCSVVQLFTCSAIERSSHLAIQPPSYTTFRHIFQSQFDPYLHPHPHPHPSMKE